MRDYQAHKNNPYWLERPLYARTLALIRDYERMRALYEYIPAQGKSVSDVDGMPHGSGVKDETYQKFSVMYEYWGDIMAIEHALYVIPEEYREGVFRNIVYQERYPDDAHPRTYAAHKQKFIYNVAHNKNWI